MSRGVFVLLEGVRSEYPDATRWVLRDGVLEIHQLITRHGFRRLAAFGRFDQVGYMT